ncbi:hypothetical protein NOK12_10080 [Nocardioides sp. OK12]|uniref:hypothetical protein n=1 Tax=Nocardioides TaxID=1839 RepID=UPI0021C3C2B8|nr:hypothetical protein [Nocardioides sp. OK12]GHJ58489.1 hypothetical protein NOK12_10080 [Nocardioides sp. OK12]
MVVLGLILLAAGVATILAGVLTAENAVGVVQVLGVDVGAPTLFLLGLASGVAVLLGVVLIRIGTRRSLQARREHKKLEELSQKLDAVEAERRRDPDEDAASH